MDVKRLVFPFINPKTLSASPMVIFIWFSKEREGVR